MERRQRRVTGLDAMSYRQYAQSIRTFGIDVISHYYSSQRSASLSSVE